MEEKIKMIPNWLRKPKAQDSIETNTAEKHTEVIDFLYRILFSRNAESDAIKHWSKFLDEG